MIICKKSYIIWFTVFNWHWIWSNQAQKHRSFALWKVQFRLQSQLVLPPVLPWFWKSCHQVKIWFHRGFPCCHVFLQNLRLTHCKNLNTSKVDFPPKKSIWWLSRQIQGREMAREFPLVWDRVLECAGGVGKGKMFKDVKMLWEPTHHSWRKGGWKGTWDTRTRFHTNSCLIRLGVGRCQFCSWTFLKS